MGQKLGLGLSENTRGRDGASWSLVLSRKIFTSTFSNLFCWQPLGVSIAPIQKAQDPPLDLKPQQLPPPHHKDRASGMLVSPWCTAAFCVLFYQERRCRKEERNLWGIKLLDLCPFCSLRFKYSIPAPSWLPRAEPCHFSHLDAPSDLDSGAGTQRTSQMPPHAEASVRSHSSNGLLTNLGQTQLNW